MASSGRSEQLKHELLALGEDVMLIEELDGLVAGLLVCPELITPGDWLPVVWGLDQENRQSAFNNIDHANRVMGLVMDHYNDVVLTLMRNPERYRPVFPLDQRNGDVLWEIWIEGFAKAIDLRPAAWDSVLDAGGEVSIAMEGMLTLIEIADHEQDLTQDEIAEVTKDAPTMIQRWIVTLNNWRLAKAKPAPVIAASPTPPFAPEGKVGRNEPCPCGSGRKYKRCCGLN